MGDAPHAGRLPTWLGALVVALSGLVYLNSLEGPFVFDDTLAIVGAPHIESLTPLSRAMDAPPGSGASGRPLVALSLAVNYALGRRQVFGYHVFNVVVHVAAGLVLFGLVRRSILLWRGRRGAREAEIDATLAATLVAALWVVHPLHTAALNHVVYRNEAMMGLFYFATLYCAARGLAAARGGAWFAASVLACALGTGCKEVIVSAPLVVLLYDRTLVAGSCANALRRRWPLYAGLAATWLLLAWIVSGGDRGETAGLAAVRGGTALDYLRTQATALPHYLRLTVWPSPLVLDYHDWPVAHSWSDAWSSGAAVVLVLAVGLAALRRGAPAGLLIVACFLVLAPTSSFVPLWGAVVAEHRMYVPVAALIALVGIAGVRVTRRQRSAGRTLTVAAAALWIGLAWATVDRNADFRTATGIWQDTIDKRPRNANAWNSYGVALAADGRGAEARTAYERALELNPIHAKALVNSANLCLAEGRQDEAVALYRRALQVDASIADAHYYLGALQLSRGSTPEAVRELREALRLGLPAKLRTPATHDLAWALATAADDGLRDEEEALALALALDRETGGRRPRLLDLLAVAQAANGDFDAARGTAQRALRLAETSGRTEFVASIRAHLASFERGQAWRPDG